MPVVGIGGVFFRAADPETLQRWYKTHLGVGGDADPTWEQQSGPTVFMPFSQETDYFPAEKQWMLNFRVTDLEALLSSLRRADIAVITNPDWDSEETGHFARIHDPEGNPIELWQPPTS